MWIRERMLAFAVGVLAAGIARADGPKLLDPLGVPPTAKTTVVPAVDDAEDPKPARTPLSAVSYRPPTAATNPKPKTTGPKPAPSPYKGLFYDNDFAYLADTPPSEYFLTDYAKQIPLGRCVLLDFGGEYRMRYHDEDILNRNSDFILQRTRLYGNAKIGDMVRLYAEAVDAVSTQEEVLPRPIEENRFDALNLFADLKLLDCSRGEGWVRGGRQELLYGAQRLVSPLDWSNTRRTFDGFKGFWRSKNWDLDGWWTRPIPQGQHTAGGVTDHNFDHPDQSREFVGLWATCKKLDDHKLNYYYLRSNEYDPAVDTFDYHTFGAHWLGTHRDWFGEFEGGYQFGEFTGLDHSAGFATVGLGRKIACLPWDPVFWVYFDWASGDADPTDNSNSTFNQLYPLGHKYFGFMDLVARQNIQDLNFRLTAKPCQKITLLLWYHIFRLDAPRDALYNAAGIPIRRDVTGAAGRDVGRELDLTATIAVTPRVGVLLGYSHLFSGGFLNNTPGGVEGEDFYYMQSHLRF